MSNKLYVGGLSYVVNDKGLRSLFATIGNVESAKVSTDFDSGRSKSIGFVEMANKEEAENAIQKLNDSIYEGRVIIISAAKPKEPGHGGYRGHGNGGRGNNRRNSGGDRFNDASRDKGDFDNGNQSY